MSTVAEHSAAPYISVVLPFYNEAGSVAALFDRLLAVLESVGETWEIICVNDGSRDETLAALLATRSREPRIAVIDFSRNFGKECALAAGLKRTRGRAVVVMDADLQHPPEAIPEMVARWREGFELVNATRHERTGQALHYRLAARTFYSLMRSVSEISVASTVGDFRLLDRRVVDVVNAMPERRRLLKGLLSWVGFRQVNIVYRQEVRHGGRSTWNFVRLARLAFDGLTSFSTVPLSIWGLIGFAVSALTFLYIVYRLIRVAIWDVDIPGYESIIIAVMFLGGMQLLSLGILGAYLGRVFEEVKQRPLYIVRQVYEGEPARANARKSAAS
ncbi:MAG: glycosyltransferase family 2 protein [Alphaproteobacteria bacterium]|nr:glycosyltransferase family 2 protein [Alphaproteobacteria bacterium]